MFDDDPVTSTQDFIKGEYKDLKKRGISKDVCQKYSYSVGVYNSDAVHVASYLSDTGRVIAQKIRTKDKEFKFFKSVETAPLFGQHLFKKGGHLIYITEGEIDCLTLAQAQKNPVVSIPNGVKSAKKAIQDNYEFLSSFKRVVLVFDSDEQGVQAMKDSCNLFKPGQVYTVSLPMKDPNEMLMNGQQLQLLECLKNAKVYSPDGIVEGESSWEQFNKVYKASEGIPYTYKCLNEKTMGIRQGELVTITAGSGIGKSTFCKEVAYGLVKQGKKVGYIALEESVGQTVQDMLSLVLNKRLRMDKNVDDDSLRKAWKELHEGDNIVYYDHWGSLNLETLHSVLGYIAKAKECEVIFLDHLSIVVSGIGDGDERRLIDNLMTELRQFVENTGVCLFLVSHLTSASGSKSYEEGEQTSLSKLRGSRAIGQLSDIAIGLERDQQDAEESNRITVRVLKNRYTGQTGVAGYLVYDNETGRINEETAEMF